MTDEDIWNLTREAYRLALEVQYKQHPELHGKIFRPRWGQYFPPSIDGTSLIPTAMQFSKTLLDLAGGYWELMRSWEAE